MDPLIMRLARGGLLLVPALLLTACVVVLPGSQGGDEGPDPATSMEVPSGRPADACTATAGQLVLERVNTIRREHGLGSLAAETRLVSAAQGHTLDQAERGSAGHGGSDGSAPADRVTAAGYQWGLVAENVGAGYASADAVVSAWMASPPHRATILSPDAIHAGVGYTFGSRGPLHHYWTLNVAKPLRAVAVGGDLDAVALRPSACHP